MKYRVTLKGGLGDILLALYSGDFMGTLDTLPAGDMIQLVILSPCRGIAELFERHPKRKQLEIIDHEYVEPLTPEFFGPYGDLQTLRQHLGPRQTPRYLSAEDLKFLSALPKKFIAFSLSSSHDNRNIPDPISLEAAEICADHGVPVLLLGRNYEPWHIWSGVRWMGKRSEPVVKAAGVVNGIDALTLPGSLEALTRASGIFCSLSAFQLAAWLYGKRSYVVTSKEFAPAIDMIGGYKVRNLRYANGHAIVRFSESWNGSDFRSFVKSL